MMKSEQRRLMLIIGGGVANFTDIRITFKGVLKALEEFKKEMKKKEIKIFVRRGGPHEKEGLQAMEEWLEQNGVYGAVSGPALPLHEIVRMAIAELKK
jgi:succinyl-CoA synthetase beta subunit